MVNPHSWRLRLCWKLLLPGGRPSHERIDRDSNDKNYYLPWRQNEYFDGAIPMCRTFVLTVLEAKENCWSTPADNRPPPKNTYTMTPFIAELLGTGMLILLGDGVVGNVVLNKSKGQNSGWIVISLGWGLGVFVAVYMAAAISGAHINPAVTIGLATAGKFPWEQVPVYLAAQFLGAAIGAFLVWLHYRLHFDSTDDPNAKLGVFCTAPAIRSTPDNLISEIIGTFVLVLGVFFLANAEIGDEQFSLGSLDALPVGLLVTVIGLALGGTTGYAINPARDLSPRIMHALLPIKGKRDSDWSYAWIPVIGPVLGAVIAAFLFIAVS